MKSSLTPERNDMAKRGLAGVTFSSLKDNFSIYNVVYVLRKEISEGSPSIYGWIRRFSWLFWRTISESRNPWYYWYTGQKIIAIQAWLVSTTIMFSIAVIATGGIVLAIIYVLIGVALESIAIVIIPLVMLIDYQWRFIPNTIYYPLIVPIFISAFFALITNRLSVFIVVHSTNPQLESSNPQR